MFQQERSHDITAVATTDGTYQGRRYFVCYEGGCGLFVPLHLIQIYKLNYACTPNRHKSGAIPCPGGLRSNAENVSGSSLKNTPHPHHGHDFYISDTLQHTPKTPENISNKFQLDEHVAFQDKHGAKHYGCVRWIGNKSSSATFASTVVGIQTVS